MELSWLVFAFQIINALITAVLAFYVHLVNKDRATNKRVDDLKEEVNNKTDDHAVRIARLEQDARRAPTHGDLGKLYGKINETAGKLEHVAGEFHAMRNLLALIHQHLMQRKE